MFLFNLSYDSQTASAPFKILQYHPSALSRGRLCLEDSTQDFHLLGLVYLSSSRRAELQRSYRSCVKWNDCDLQQTQTFFSFSLNITLFTRKYKNQVLIESVVDTFKHQSKNERSPLKKRFKHFHACLSCSSSIDTLVWRYNQLNTSLLTEIVNSLINYSTLCHVRCKWLTPVNVILKYHHVIFAYDAQHVKAQHPSLKSFKWLQWINVFSNEIMCERKINMWAYLISYPWQHKDQFQYGGTLTM